MWGEDEILEKDDDNMSVDYSGDSDSDKDEDPFVPQNSWKEFPLHLGITEEQLSEFAGLPGIPVTKEDKIKLWNVADESRNPWVAVSKWHKSPKPMEGKDIGHQAYWIGSEICVGHMPHMLIKLLNKIDK